LKLEDDFPQSSRLYFTEHHIALPTTGQSKVSLSRNFGVLPHHQAIVIVIVRKDTVSSTAARSHH
jgi:hypothetical protein